MLNRVCDVCATTEGDRKAYFETSQWTIRQNKETISSIKQENKDLRQHLAQLHSEQKRKQSGGISVVCAPLMYFAHGTHVPPDTHVSIFESVPGVVEALLTWSLAFRLYQQR